jgi:hypothetical protein
MNVQYTIYLLIDDWLPPCCRKDVNNIRQLCNIGCKRVHTVHEPPGATYAGSREVVDQVVTNPLPSPFSVVADDSSSEAIPTQLGEEEMSNSTSDKSIIQAIVSKCREIAAAATAGNLDRETLLAIEKQLTATKATVMATATASANFRCMPLSIARRLPANKTLDKQFRFDSVVVKRRLALHRLRKPSATQLMAVKTTLLRRTAGSNENVEPSALSAEGCGDIPYCVNNEDVT